MHCKTIDPHTLRLTGRSSGRHCPIGQRNMLHDLNITTFFNTECPRDYFASAAELGPR